MRRLFHLAVAVAVLSLAPPPAFAQRAVKASTGWVQAPAAGSTEATAFVTVENGTMYDVYLVGAESEAAAKVVIQHASSNGGAATVMAEAPVPAFSSLEMFAGGVHLVLHDLKRPLTPGDTVPLVVVTDQGERLTVAATVK